MSLRQLVRDWAPPALLRARARRLGGQIRWRGDHPSWAAAQAACTGYDDSRIIELVATAVSEVLAGRAAYERDSVCFPRPAIRYPVLAACQLAAVDRTGAVVVDYGGSLGSAWLQHRHLLETLGLRWRVVEQPAFVERGRALFPDGQPTFHDSLDEACAEGPPALALLGAVLPYLPDPAATLTAIAEAGPDWILVDRTSIHDGPRDRLAVQEVPPAIYPAAYPCWIFARDTIPRLLAGSYALVDDFACEDVFIDPLRLHGWLFRRIRR